MDVTIAIKVFGLTTLFAVIGSVVGVNLFCSNSKTRIDKCRRRVLFVIERLTYSIFNTLIAAICLMGYLFYVEEPFKMESLYFVIFLGIVLISSAISFEVTRMMVNVFRKRFETELNKVSGDN